MLLSLGLRFRKLHRKSNCSEATSSLAANAAASLPIFLRPNQTPPCSPTTRTFEPRSSPSVRSSTNEKATPTLLLARIQFLRRYSRGRFGPRRAHHRHGCSSSACFLWCGPKKTATMLMLRSSRRSGIPRPHTAGRGADSCPTTQPRESSPLHRPGAVPTQIVVRARAVRPEYDHIADATFTSAAVRRPPERPARRRDRPTVP